MLVKSGKRQVKFRLERGKGLLSRKNDRKYPDWSGENT